MPQRALPGYDDIYFKNSSEKFKNLWNFANQLIAWTTITPIFYTGAIAGSEFLTYNAGKLYIALELEFQPLGSANVGASYITLHGIGDVVMVYPSFDTIAYNTTTLAINFKGVELCLYNYYFTRIASSLYTGMKFNGFRLTV